MAKATIQDRLCAGLSVLGFVESKPTTRYRVFLPTDLSRLNFKSYATKILVGSAGAFRGSVTGHVEETFAYNDTARERVLGCGDTSLAAKVKK